MGRLFDKALDIILEDQSLFAPAVAKSQELNTAKNAVIDLEGELQNEVDALLNQLALEIRRKSPRLTVTLGRNGVVRVNFGRFPKALDFGVDLTKNMFKVGSSKFEREFLRNHHYILGQGADLVADAVADFFSKKYKAMR